MSDSEMPEISDVIVAFDPETRERLPVLKRAAMHRFEHLGNRRAARIVEAIPDRGGVLDPDAVDALLLRAHAELQRLSEEFEHGRRVAELLGPLLDVLREQGARRPIRVVDVGCGPGFVARWLAARGRLGDDIELVGVDYNVAFVREAERLAAIERLPVRFLVDNAFRLAEPAAIYMTTGVVHHFRGPGLAGFFRGQEHDECRGFLHFDFQPSPLARPGAWLFHIARMREPLSVHDGVLSAMRAHSANALLAAAREGAPSFRAGIYGARLSPLPLPRVFHTLIGLRPELAEPMRRRLGSRASRLGELA